jgi:uncharacterized protein (TIGR04255 family)
MPHYKNAPITEAVIDIRIKGVGAGVTFETLENIKPNVPDYPHQQKQTVNTVTFNFGPSGNAVAGSATPEVIILRNQAKNQVVQFGMGGFSFSKLAPYQSFDLMRDEAKRLWGFYSEFVKPSQIVRVALRYINLLNFPETLLEPQEYLNTFPTIPSALPSNLQVFDHFLVNLRLPQPDLGERAFLIINESGAPATKPGVIPFILDLDLFVENPPITNDQQLWGFFDSLRMRKNQYFEASITDKTRELIR